MEGWLLESADRCWEAVESSEWCGEGGAGVSNECSIPGVLVCAGPEVVVVEGTDCCCCVGRPLDEDDPPLLGLVHTTDGAVGGGWGVDTEGKVVAEEEAPTDVVGNPDDDDDGPAADGWKPPTVEVDNNLAACSVGTAMC